MSEQSNAAAVEAEKVERLIAAELSESGAVDTAAESGFAGAAGFADAESREILNLLGGSDAAGGCCGGSCCS